MGPRHRILYTPEAFSDIPTGVVRQAIVPISEMKVLIKKSIIPVLFHEISCEKK